MKEQKVLDCTIKWDCEGISINKGESSVILDKREAVGCVIVFQEIFSEWKKQKNNKGNAQTPLQDAR